MITLPRAETIFHGEHPGRHDRFFFHAIGDKILWGGKIRYLLFFEADEPCSGQPPGWGAQVFASRNGFHAIGPHLGDHFDKFAWFQEWLALYPRTDYRMANVNWLAPQTEEELDFIMSLCPSQPMLAKYYRDKSVFE